MADIKISELSASGTLDGTEIVPIVQDGSTVQTTTQEIADLATPDTSGLVPYTGATSDVDLGNYNMNAKSFKANGTGGNGHLGLKHQSSDATPGGSETAIFAGIDGEPRYKNDGNAVQQFASRAWVTAQGYITNVITALGFTPENVANKQTDLTASSTKYPTVDAVNTGLATKQATLTDSNFGTFSNSLTAKTIPVDADSINISDSADSNKAKKLSFENLKTALSNTFTSGFIQKQVNSSAVTGTTAETLVFTFTVPANSFSSNDIMKFFTSIQKTGSLGTTTIRLKHNTSNDFSTATQLAISGAQLASSLYIGMRRESFTIGSNTLQCYSATTNALDDVIANSSVWRSISFDTTSTNYFFVSIQLSNSADSVVIRSSHISNL